MNSNQMRPRMRRPMARVKQIGLFSREVKENLSLAGAELLLASATTMTEGQLLSDGHYFGTSMITVDLNRAADKGLVRNSEISTAIRLARLMESSEAFRDRVRQIAHEAAEKQSSTMIDRAEIDVRVRAEGKMIFIDADVEATACLEVASGEL